MSEPRSLGEILGHWPHSAPQTGRDLIFASVEDLRHAVAGDQIELVLELRRHMIDAGRSMGRSTQLGTALEVARALESGQIRTVAKRWTTYALDRHKRVTWKPVANDSSRAVNTVTRFVPDLDKLPKLEQGGGYLMLWGGSPDVLDITDVQQRLIAIAEAEPLKDVIFRHLVRGETAAVYSARLGAGARGVEQLEMTQTTFLERLKEAAQW